MATLESATSKSIFEDDNTPQPQPQATTEVSTAEKPTKEEVPMDKPVEENVKDEIENEDEKSILDDEEVNPNKHETYPPNSLNEAKASFLKNKSIEKHKYSNGQRSPKHSTQTKIAETMSKIVDDVKQQIDAGTDKLLHEAEDAMASISATTGIAFAPINIPLKRRRQTFAVLLWASLYFVCLFLNFCAWRYWTGWKFYAYLAYIGWKGLYQTFHCDGGLPIPWFRNAFIWQWFVDYFPIRLHKTCDLDNSGQTSYIFGYHPHGIIGIGAVSTFGMMTSGFQRLFPGVDVRLLTLRMNFFIPFFDLIITFLGMCDASKESCNAILGDVETKSLCLVLGGAKEALEAEHEVVKLVLAKRKGFVKIALQNGASMVPVFGFGENELFDQVQNPQGSTLRKIQNRLQQTMGFSMPLFHGRGVFQYDYGIMPIRRPIDVVFGKPIKCPKIERSQITADILDKYHSMYCQELKTLFDQQKEKYYPKDQKLPTLEFI